MSPEWDDPRETPHDSGEGGDRERLDIDAEFEKIVAAYGEQPTDGPRTEDLGDADSLAERFKVYGWSDSARDTDSLNSPATWEDEGHFVPPEPPPVPRPEPARLIAWLGVLGAPLVMLVIVVARWVPPTWVSFLLACGFVGGMAYLVATMRRDDDRWPGDDGAVL